MRKIWKITRTNGREHYEKGEKLSDWLFGDNRNTHDLIQDLIDSEVEYLRSKENDSENFNYLVWNNEDMDLVDYLSSRGYRNFEIDRDILNEFISNEKDADKLRFLNKLKGDFEALIEGGSYSDRLYSIAQNNVDMSTEDLDVGSIEDVACFLGVEIELWGWENPELEEIPMQDTLICPSCEEHSLTDFVSRKNDYETDHDQEYKGEGYYCFGCGKYLPWNDKELIEQNSHLDEEFWISRAI